MESKMESEMESEMELLQNQAYKTPAKNNVSIPYNSQESHQIDAKQEALNIHYNHRESEKNSFLLQNSQQ